jgi:hypothetical protein
MASSHLAPLNRSAPREFPPPRAAKKFPRAIKNGLHFFTFAPDSAFASSTERRSIAETLRQITGPSRTASDWVD